MPENNNTPSTNLGLDPQRLSMLDEFGHKKVIIPSEVKGIWRTRRNKIYAFLILVFLFLPWTQINNLQTILLDIPNRKFIIFGIQFWAHDAPMIFFLLAFSAFGLAFVTSIWGRVWCGWACPQTVFIDFIYRRIEIWIEGPYLKRRELARQEMNFSKLIKKIIKWSLYFLASSFIAHSFTAYFVGSKPLMDWVFSLNISEHESTFYIITFITLVLLFDFGWFREQFCIIMCPYGRFQSVLMDNKSQTVLYDNIRGEPRRGSSAQTTEKIGSCVSCSRCVQVCPTGIDIRNGLQLECIACTACMDACDEIMEKVKQPKGLIRYQTVSGKKNKITSPRSLIYLILVFLSILGLTYTLMVRKNIDIAILRGKDIPYQIIKAEDGTENIINHFKWHIKNQSFTDSFIQIKLPEKFMDLKLDLKIPENPVFVHSGKDKTIHAFVVFKKEILKRSDTLKLQFEAKAYQSSSESKTIPATDLTTHPTTQPTARILPEDLLIETNFVPFTLVGPK